MADPVTNRGAINQFAGASPVAAINQALRTTAPQAPMLGAAESSSQHLAFANIETSATPSVSAPVQLAGVNGVSSVPAHNEFAKPAAVAFYIAAGKGDLSMLKEMLNAGMPIDAQKAPGIYAIAKAVSSGHLNVVTYLTEKGACAEARCCALSAAAIELHLDENSESAKKIAQYLIRSFPEGQMRKAALDRAAELGGVSGKTSPLLNDLRKKVEVGDFVLAARAGDIAKLNAYIADGMEVGARVGAEEPTALVQAARKSRVDAVQYLLTQNPSLTDKKDALLAVAFELAFSSDDVGNSTRLKQIVASIVRSEPDARSLLNDVVGSLEAQGELDVACTLRNLFH